MSWNSIWPDPTKSVAANTPKGQENTNYIETTMNNDHFWNIGTNQDGRHNAINMPKQDSDPATSTGMDGTVYLKEVSADNSRVQGFYRNTNGIYQFIPSFLSGTVTFTNATDYVTITSSISNNSYGQIYLYVDSAESASFQVGHFKAISGVLQAYSTTFDLSDINISLGNGSNASALQLKGRLNSLTAGLTYQYRIVYWGM